MALRRMWDAAWAPDPPPSGWDACAGYIGGNTPHVWTDAEWARQPARWRLPIFTRSVGGVPTVDAATVISWLLAHHVPKGVCVALDFETRVDPDYLRAFDQTIVKAGWKTIVYGTRRTVLANPEPSGGYWDAQWTNTPHLSPGSAATQYGGDTTLGQPYDASLVADSTPLWDTKEDPMTPEEHDALLWLRANAVTLKDQAVRLSDHGDQTVTGSGNHHKAIRADIATLADAILGRLDAGLTVHLDLASLSPEQTDQLAKLIAGHMVVQSPGYTATLSGDLIPKTP